MATLGWCFGGGWRLNASILNPEIVAGFEASMNEAGKTHTIHMYEANHAFSNPPGQAYDEEDAKLAWSRTLEFLNAKLK